jgi:protein associated with RNAse G/E
MRVDMPMRIGAAVHVRKLEYGTRRELISWPGTLVELSNDVAVVRAPFKPFGTKPVFVDGVPLVSGDVFTEYYFLNRWYNVYHIADADGAVKGWYCNVTRPPEVDEDGISYVDMALDLFVHPDGRATVLDEDEFALASESVYDRRDVEPARVALQDLLQTTAEGRLPSPSHDR